jgi:hypothetical protein
MELLNQGAILWILLTAGALALALGMVILGVYRRAIEHEMRSAAAEVQPVSQDRTSRRRPQSDLSYRLEEIGSTRQAQQAPLSGDPSLLGAAVYALAGIAFGATSTILLFVLSDTEFLPLRTACVSWAYAWPVVLTLNLIWTGDRRRQLGVTACYALVIAFFCLWSTATAFLNPVLLWAIFASPSVYLLLFLNRTVRAIGPVLLVFTTLILVGWHIAMGVLGSPVGMRAASQIFLWTDLGATGLILAVTVAGLTAGMAAGWAAVRWLADAYAARRFSEQTLVIDSIWFGQSLILCSSLAFEMGVWAFVGLIPIAIYKAVCVMGFRQLSTKQEPQPLRLLLLRVFGFGGRSSRLFDLVASRWRYVGIIRVIAAPDLASRTIDVSKLLAFVRGRLDRLFVRDETALAQRLLEMDERRDPDGRFRIAEFFCAGEVWRSAVRKLMIDAHLVVMDLRSFGPRHEGCAFELQMLLDLVPLERMALLINQDTDVQFLKQVLNARWRALSASSPNAAAREPMCVLMKVDAHEMDVVQRLIQAGLGHRAPDSSRDRRVRPQMAQPQTLH